MKHFFCSEISNEFISSSTFFAFNFLRNEYKTIIDKKFNFSSLFLNYWKSKFNLSENIFNLNEMTIDEFKIFIKKNHS